MSSRILLGVTFVVFVTVIGAAFYLMPQNQPMIVTDPITTSTPTTTAAATSTNTTAAPRGYTMTAVVQHHNASSCWTVINGNVYDLTKWINQHPGGPENIMAICGSDGSAAFNGQHSGDRQAANELKNFLLGPLSS